MLLMAYSPSNSVLSCSFIYNFRVILPIGSVVTFTQNCAFLHCTSSKPSAGTAGNMTGWLNLKPKPHRRLLTVETTKTTHIAVRMHICNIAVSILLASHNSLIKWWRLKVIPKEKHQPPESFKWSKSKIAWINWLWPLFENFIIYFVKSTKGNQVCDIPRCQLFTILALLNASAASE